MTLEDIATPLTVLAVKDGEVLVRPIGPQDDEALLDMIHRADPRDVRSRFHAAVQEPPPSLIHRLTHIDYSHEQALIALIGTEIVGVARMVDDEQDITAEFALAVRTDQQRRGIGRGLMLLLLEDARRRGLTSLWGMIEIENERMLGLARELGFTPLGVANHGEVRVGLTLKA